MEEGIRPADGFTLDTGEILAALERWVTLHVLTWDVAVQAGALVLVLAITIFARRLFVPPLEKLVSRAALPALLRYPLHRLVLVIGPALAALLVWFAYAIAGTVEIDNELLRIAGSLLLAWVIIRFITSFLRQAGWAALIATLVWLAAALAILGWLDALTDLLNTAAFTIGTLRISLMGVVQGVLVLAVFLWLSGLLVRLVDDRMTRLEGVTAAARVLIVKVLRILFYAIAILVALTTIGIDLTVLAVFSGALGIGIGFGLQKVVSNLFSGIILLLDRSLKPGDVIEIGDAYGWIEKMGARYVTVVTRDGKEFLIPNEDLITQHVINWSYSDTAIRLKIGVGISYRSDVRKAMELMVEAALAQDRVLKDDAHMPQVRLVEFGNSSVDLELRMWVADPQRGIVNIASEIRLAIWDLFHENGIEFPFPQRDLHIKSADGLREVMRDPPPRPEGSAA